MQKTLLRKLMSLFMVAGLVLALPVQALADTYYLEEGAVEITAHEDGNHSVKQNGATKNERDEAPKVTGNFSGYEPAITIKSDEGASAKVTIEDVNIKAPYSSGIEIQGDSKAEITVKGDNTVTSAGYDGAAVHVSNGDLTLTGGEGDSLNAVSGGWSAAIGTNYGEDMTGNITITGDGLSVNANSVNGAGIGTGLAGNMKEDGSITISGENTKVTSGSYDGAGIGTGYHGDMAGNITLGGVNTEVTASSQLGDDIGAGQYGTCTGEITEPGSEPDPDPTPDPDPKPDPNPDPETKPEPTPELNQGFTYAETIRALYYVQNGDGKYLSTDAERAEGVLTVRVDAENASFHSSAWGLGELRKQGVKTVTFVTSGVSSSFDVAEVLEALGSGNLVLSHGGSAASLTLNGAERNELLK